MNKIYGQPGQRSGPDMNKQKLLDDIENTGRNP